MKIEIEIEKPEKIKTETLRHLKIWSAPTNLPHKYNVIAVDPGVNFGLVFFVPGRFIIYEGSLLKKDQSLEYALEAYNFIRSWTYEEGDLVVIEGAAYHKTFGQVGLADVRTGFYLGACTMVGSGSVKVVPPMTVRKAVFGDGRYQPANEWPTLHHNAADALSIALFGMGAQVRTEAEAKARYNFGLLDLTDS